MRRMSDKNPYASEIIRTNRVLDAAKYLVKQPLYLSHNIVITEDWIEEQSKLLSQNNNMHIILNNENDDVEVNRNENLTHPTVEENSDDEWEDQINNEPPNIINEETLLQDDYIAIKFAPGENKIPISLLMDEDIRELSFPTIYGGQERQIKTKLSKAQIAKSEARMYDRRCAKNIPQLFLSYCLARVDKLVSHIQICLRKKNPTIH